MCVYNRTCSSSGRAPPRPAAPPGPHPHSTHCTHSQQCCQYTTMSKVSFQSIGPPAGGAATTPLPAGQHREPHEVITKHIRVMRLSRRYRNCRRRKLKNKSY